MSKCLRNRDARGVSVHAVSVAEKRDAFTYVLFSLVGEYVTYFDPKENTVSTITSTSRVAARARWRVRALTAVGAPVALLVSLGAPLSGHGISASNRLSLVLMHVAVAGVVIPLYHRTAVERAASQGVGRS